MILHGRCLHQVGTSDGRVKIIGRDGVECTFKAPNEVSTRQLHFLDSKGSLLRVTQVSVSFLWDRLALDLIDAPCRV